MAQSAKKPLSVSNIEEAYNRHKPRATEVQAEYDKQLGDVFTDINAACLEPFTAVLLKEENIIVNADIIAERIRTKMNQTLPLVHENFFIANDVAKKLITLEVLKERYEPYKGTAWNVNKMSPQERTRPIRMRLIDSSIRFIEKQLISQEKAIEAAKINSRKNRERLQSIQTERVKLNALMQQQSEYYKEMSPKLETLFTKLIDLNNAE